MIWRNNDPAVIAKISVYSDYRILNDILTPVVFRSPSTSCILEGCPEMNSDINGLVVISARPDNDVTFFLVDINDSSDKLHIGSSS